MRIIRGLHNLRSQFINGCVVTIGNYDGVHLGHQQIIETVKRRATELKLPAVAIIFEPHPEEFFSGDKLSQLTSLREKIPLLEQYGIDAIVLLSFNRYIAGVTALQFIAKILVGLLRVRFLVVGDDFTFGYRCTGGFSLLEQEAVAYGFQLAKMPSFKIDGVRVSSSLIREALRQGDLHIAAKFLGRPYRVNGRVVYGDQHGRDLGFPTANIHLGRRELPIVGVYIVKVYALTQSSLFGVANIGFRPTILGKQKLLEVHILKFNGDIYGRRITVEFCKKIRDEHKFSSLSELQLQIKRDLIVAREYFKNLINV